MAKFLYKTGDGTGPNNKPRVYFTCHPEDVDCAERLFSDIFRTHNCVIFYTEDMSEPIGAAEQELDLGRNNLFVVTVTEKLLCQPNRAMDVDIPFARKQHIPILPIMLESGLEEIYSLPNKFGNLQYLSICDTDATAISYSDKLKKYLDSTLIGKELADRVRAAFKAYIFLSYRKKDRAFANELMRMIHADPRCRDIAVWFDEFLTPGENFLENIQSALASSELFTLLVTPSLLEEPEGKPNFVMAEEYPAARKVKKKILAVEMQKTDRKILKSKFRGIPECVDPDDKDGFYTCLQQALAHIAHIPNKKDPEHNFLIGLAYLEGIDVEVDRQKAVMLITDAAEADLPEAMEQLIHMYTDGVGVPCDRQQATCWSQRLCDLFYQRIFTHHGTLGDEDALQELFRHYANSYWAEAITLFLQKADAGADFLAVQKMYTLLEGYGIHEYTLLFEACRGMNRYRERSQLQLVLRILHCSIDGTYPPYGNLFWYIPEFELYETALLAAQILDGNARALALVRDVCFIFGQYDSIGQVTDRVDGDALFAAAQDDLKGVRRALCQRFYTGTTSCTGGEDIYPRCFNPAEAEALACTGMGINGRMTTLFHDELGLFGTTKRDSMPIGLMILPYDNQVERILSGSIPFVRGLILLDTDNVYLDYLEFNRRNLKVFYIPENCTQYDKDYATHLQLDLSVQILSNDDRRYYGPFAGKSHQYLRSRVRIPESYTGIRDGSFMNCTGLLSVDFPAVFAKEESWDIADFEDNSDLQTEDISNAENEEEDDYFSGAELGDRCFENCVKLTELEIPSNVRSVGSRAFYNCNALVRLRLPNTLHSLGVNAVSYCSSLEELTFGFCGDVGNRAFEGCRSLKTVRFSDGFERIGLQAFAGCKKLERIDFKPGIRMIADYAFSGTGLRQVEFRHQTSYTVSDTIPEAYQDWWRFSLGIGVFSGCDQLEKVVLPDDLTVIPPECFAECSRLCSLYLSEQLEEIRDRAFINCSRLSTVSFPSALKTIGIRSFAGCGLTALELPESVTQIGNGAFANNRSLKQIRISNPNIHIDRHAFEGCEVLTKAFLPDSLQDQELGLPAQCEIVWLGSGQKQPQQSLHIQWLRKIPAAAYRQRTDLVRVTVEDAIAIEDHAFEGCAALESVVLPEYLTEIGHWAFAGCGNLQSLPFLSQIRVLGGGAFEDCIALTEVTLHEDITSLDGWVFSRCSRLKSVALPPKLQLISSGAFFGCEVLTIPERLPFVTEVWDKAFANCKSIETLQLPTVVMILDRAFACCFSLNTLQVGSGLELLGEGAFYGCSALRTVELAHTQLRELPDHAFEQCTILGQVTLPSTLEDIGQEAFFNCLALRHLELPESLKKVGAGAFALCTQLRCIRLPNVNVLQECVFLQCAQLESVQLSPELVHIKEAAFAECSALRQIPLGRMLKSIGDKAFSDCTALKSIRIPLSVTQIGDEAFAGCTGLTSVWISRNFQPDILRIFGQIDQRIIHYYDTEEQCHTAIAQAQEDRISPEPVTIKPVSFADIKRESQKALTEELTEKELNEAVETLLSVGKASVAILQRRLKIGFGRAARIVDRLEALGILGPMCANMPREVLLTQEQWETMGKHVPPQ